MDTDTDRIDDAVLALLYLTLHDHDRAWKGFDWAALSRLHAKGLIDDPVNSAKSLTFTPNGLQRSRELFESMFAGRAAAASVSPVASAQAAKYPAIQVDLADLGGDMWPILRRVSYAMSDADVDDAEIERYKSEVRDSDDPVGVSRRWVSVP